MGAGIDERLKGYDWANAFQGAGEIAGEINDGTEFAAIEGQNNTATIHTVPGYLCDPKAFNRADVVEIIGIAVGEHDAADWLCAGRLKDGRWFCLHASCRHSGWDCRSGGSATVTWSREVLLRLGMTDEERTRMGLVLPVEGA